MDQQTLGKLLAYHLTQISIAITGILGLITTAEALEVKIQPEQPKLGETISVFITTEQSNSAPQVETRGTTYPVFPVNFSTNTYRALIPTTPLDSSGLLTIEVTEPYNREQETVSLWLNNRTFPTQRIRLSKKGIEPTPLELERVAQFKQLVTPEKFWQGKFLRPNRARVSTVFGVRRYYNGVFAQNYYHRGVDYAGWYGSPIIAPAAGKVALVGREQEGYRLHGNVIGIDHGQGVLSIFLHLSTIEVQEGGFVQAGQKIGTVGSTGASTGPHLHWGLYVHGQAVDPVPWRFTGIE